jgi:Fe-S-cluster containining protein
VDWIKRGLRFECQPDCGKCCTNEREGSVFLEPADVERLAAKLDLSPHRFLAKYTTREEGSELELAKTREGHCVFLSERKCTVQDAKPLQCAAYPFLPLDGFTPIESHYTWRYEKTFCPGIGKGPLYPKSRIVAISRGRGWVEGFDV